MREAQCVRYPIKPGQRETMVNWIARLKDRSAEVTEAMAEAGLVAEAVFLERSADGDHVLIYTDTKDLTAANEALAPLSIAAGPGIQPTHGRDSGSGESSGARSNLSHALTGRLATVWVVWGELLLRHVPRTRIRHAHCFHCAA
jgi:hypothetical protein